MLWPFAAFYGSNFYKGHGILKSGMSNTPYVLSQLTLFSLAIVLSATVAGATPNLPTTIATITAAGTSAATATAQPSPSSPPSLLLQTAAAQTQSPSQS